MEHITAYFVLAQGESNCFLLIYGSIALAAAFSVNSQGLLEVVSQTKVIHYQAAWLIAVDTVDASNGLHQAMTFHWLINVHCMKRRDIKARQPHIADDGNFE